MGTTKGAGSPTSSELPSSGPHKGGTFKGMHGGQDPCTGGSHHDFMAKVGKGAGASGKAAAPCSPAHNTSKVNK